MKRAHLTATRSCRTTAIDLRLQTLPLLLACVYGLAYAQTPALNALPQGAQVISGQASLLQSGNLLRIQQSSPRLITNWQSFNIGAQAGVQFVQPSASSVALNQVLSSDPSQIFGTLSANGQVFLSNPQGVIFGPSSRIDVGGLLATSLKLSNEDFLANRINLTQGATAGLVKNMGQLLAQQGGYVALVGGQVSNEGQIIAPQGTAALASGGDVRLTIGDTGLVSVKVDTASPQARIDQSGLIAADGGRVHLSAMSAAPALATAVNQTGTVRANTIVERGGEIYIEANGGVAQIGGQLQAAGQNTGEKGGLIAVTGAEVHVGPQARIDASGAAGGGTVLLGGGWQGDRSVIDSARKVRVDAGAEIRTDATQEGQGGTTVLWSEQATEFKGDISARGAGSGRGGQVETSSRGALGVTGSVTVDAPSGTGGRWLLDPATLKVVETAVQPDEVAASTIQSTLNGVSANAVDLLANAITVTADIAKTAGGASTLTLRNTGATNGTIDINGSISSNHGVLNVVLGDAAMLDGGRVTINGALSTNGGNVTVYKPVTLASTTPITTKISDAASTSTSGSVNFFKDVTLAAPGYNVTINTQGPQSGLPYTGNGGNILFQGNVMSGEYPASVFYPHALTLDTTGANSGSITLGTTSANYVGGAGAAGLKSLTLLGTANTLLNAGTLNLYSTSGDVLTASSQNGAPTITLNAANTVINVTGGSYGGYSGYTDYLQSTFDIIKGVSAQTLTINADRSIKMVNHSIKSTTANAPLQVTLNAFHNPSAVGGGVVLNNSSIQTEGGAISLSGTGLGTDLEGIKDGIYLQNSQLNSTRASGSAGSISLVGNAPATNASGAGVRIVGGQSVISAGSADLTITGTVSQQAGAGNKDGVILGEDGSSRVSLQTTSGDITITGDASGVGTNVSGGSRYDGVIISSRASISTDSGAISITGKGGGGNSSYVSENHGIKIEDTDTRIVSATGNIALLGTSGGKVAAPQGENSFGIYAAGNTMYVGADSSAYSTATGLLSASPATAATGAITLAADSMNFINNSPYHLKVASAGGLRVHTQNAVTKIEFGTAGGVNVPGDASQKSLYLGSNWFNGSTLGIFQPGFHDIVIGNAASSITTSTGLMNTVGSTNSMTVSEATTLRDNTVLDMDGAGGNIKVNADLRVKGLDGSSRNLLINTDGGAVGAGTIEAHGLMLLGSRQLAGNASTLHTTTGASTGDTVLTGNNLVDLLSVDLNGRLTFNNVQNLQISNQTHSYGVSDQSYAPSVNGIKTVAVGNQVVVSVNGGNLTLAAPVDVGNATFAMNAGISSGNGGAISQAASGGIAASKLAITAQNGVDLTAANNQVRTLAADLTGGNFSLIDNKLLDIDTVQVTPLSASSLGSVTAGATATTTGLRTTGGQISVTANSTNLADNNGTLTVTQAVSSANNSPSGANILLRSTTGSVLDNAAINAGTAGTLTLQADTGAVTQSATGSVTANALQVTARDNSDLLTATNDVGTLAASITGSAQRLRYADANALTIGTVTTDGIVTKGGEISVTTGGDLTVAKAVNSTNATVAGANVTLRATTGSVFDNAAINAGTAGTLTLQADTGAVTQSATGSVTANALQVTARDNSDLLTATNDVGTLAANITGSAQRLRYADANALTIGTVTTDGIVTKGGEISVTTGGDLTVAKAVNSTNATVAGANVTLRATTGSVFDNAAINAGTAGTLTLQADTGAVTQSATGSVTANALQVTARDNSDLLTATNDVGTLAASITGSAQRLRYADANALTIGTVTTDGIVTKGGEISVTTGGDLTVAKAVNSTNATVAGANVTLRATTGSVFDNAAINAGTAGTLTLQADTGAVTQSATGSVTANALQVTARDNSDLLTATNDVGTLAANITGSAQRLRYADANALTIGTVTTDGIVTKGGEISVTTGGDLTVAKAVNSTNATVAGANVTLRATTGSVFDNAAINAGTAGTLTLQADTGAVTQSATGSVTANALQVVAQNTSSLGVSSNDVGTLATNITGLNQDVTYRDANALTLGTVTANGITTSGLTTHGGLATLQVGGNLGQGTTGLVNTAKLQVLSSGAVDLSQVNNQIAQVAGQSSGDFHVRSSTSLAVASLGGTNGITSGGHAMIESDQDVSLLRAVIANGSGNAAVIRAGARFNNLASPGNLAIQTPNGRWIVYDNNPELEEKDMGGLPRNVLLLETRYEDRPPSQVTETGNVYVTTSVTSKPEANRQSVPAGAPVDLVMGGVRAGLCTIELGRHQA